MKGRPNMKMLNNTILQQRFNRHEVIDPKF